MRKKKVKKSKAELSAIAAKAVETRRKNNPSWGRKKKEKMIKKTLGKIKPGETTILPPEVMTE